MHHITVMLGLSAVVIATTNILFPGDPACGGDGCERELAGDGLVIPDRNGKPWGDTYAQGPMPAHTIAGYSSGRIALLRRLALIGDGRHVVLIDPSADDGKRDYTGRGPERGEDIVARWLAADPRRTFTLIYSTKSDGWERYAALQRRPIGERVRVCSVDTPHYRVPATPGLAEALADPRGPLEWDNGTCRWGASRMVATREAPRHQSY